MAEPLPMGNSKDMWTDMPRLTEISKRANRVMELFSKESYQINPYTMKSLTYVTGKVGEKPPCIGYQNIPGFNRIKCLYMKKFTPPMQKVNQSGPETEYQRHGWFKKTFNEEDYDDRFIFTHRTPDFIKTQMKIRAYDKTMSDLMASKNSVA